MTVTAEPQVLKQCERCAASFPVPADPLVAKHARFCGACCAEAESRREAERVAVQQERRAASWAALCPKAFRQTVRELLPDPSKLDEVLAWRCERGGVGLLLHGPTRTGKSRCAWELLRREHFTGRSVRAMSAMSGVDYAASFAEGASYAAAWLRRFVAADILLLDDCVKARLTDSFEGALFALVNERVDRCRPIVVTLNDTGESLMARMTTDRGMPLVERLREHCKAVAFTK